MAEVTGNIGQESVVLNNAATEVTLKQILAAMQALAAKSGAKIDTGSFERDLGKLADESKKAAAAGKKFTSASKEAYLAEKEAAEAAKQAAKSSEYVAEMNDQMFAAVGRVKDGFLNLVSRVSSAANTIQGMGDSVTGAVDALGQIPLGVGELISGVFGPVAAAVEDAHGAFLEVASVGANFGGNMNVVMNQAAAAGLTLDQYSGIVKNNSEALMMMGGSVEEGAKRLAQLGKDVRNSPIGDELARLGYSTTAINEGFADYSKLLAKNGRLQGMTDKQLREGTAAYLKDLDAVAKLTGKSKESLQAEEDARQADAQYRIMMSKLDADGQKNMEALMKSIPAQHQAGLKEILATGTATTEAGVQALAYLKESGQSAMSLHKSMQQSGTLSQDQVTTFNKTYQAEADKLAKSPLMETLGKFDPAANDFVVGVLDVAARTKDLATIYEETDKKLKATKDGMTAEPLLDAATVQTFKQNIAEASVKFKQDLANIDLGPMEEMFTKAMDVARDLLVPAIDMAGKNIYALAAAVATATVAIGAKGALGSYRAGKDRLASAKKADLDKGIDPKKLKGGKTLLKGVIGKLGPLAMAGMAGYDAVSGYNNASDILGLKEGQEATTGQKTSAAVGSALSGLTFGMVDEGQVARGIADFFGAGNETEKEKLKRKISQEKERVARSEAGEDEYWGSEEGGRQDSLEEIAALEKKLEALEKREAAAAAAAAGKPTTPGTPSTPAPGTPAVPTDKTSATDQAQKSLEADADKKKAEEKKKEETKKAEEQKAAEDAAGSIDGASIQKKPEDVQLALNTNIEELVRLTRAQLNIANKQLRTTEGMTGNLMA